MTKLAAVTASVLLTTTAFAQQDSQKSLDYSLDTGNVEITPAGETQRFRRMKLKTTNRFFRFLAKKHEKRDMNCQKVMVSMLTT